MTSGSTMACPTCAQPFQDEPALWRHAEEAHQVTRQQMEQQAADTTMGRQQDVAGRREQAGQPGGEAPDGDQGRHLQQARSTAPGDGGQQTQQQQPQTDASLAGQNASQDAGWARLSSPDGRVDLGRGRLHVWYEAPGSANGVRHAQVKSYTPGPTEVHRGDTIAISPEAESEQYLAKVMEYQPVQSGESVLVLDWPDDELPASLRELGGE